MAVDDRQRGLEGRLGVLGEPVAEGGLAAEVTLGLRDERGHRRRVAHRRAATILQKP